jgi:FkbM family methyltransferase
MADAAAPAPSNVEWLQLPDPSGGPPIALCVPVDRPDRVAQEIAQGSWSPPAALRCVLDSLTAGATLVDLGAHLGTVALPAARRGARVIAVEASPRNAACLVQSVAANGLDVTVVPVAVAATRSRVRFREDGPFGRVTDDPDAVEVEALPVPDILERARVSAVDVVKIDVEGQELAVLDSMRGLLTESENTAIVIEGNGFTLMSSGLTPRDLLDRLHSHGFTTWRIGDHELTRTQPGQIQSETVVDYLAARGAPPWPERPAPSDDEITGALAAEGRHALWTHRRYVAGALSSAPDAFIARPEIRDTLENLVLDPSPGVREAVAWWLKRPASHDLRSISASCRTLARAMDAIRARLSQGEHAGHAH